MEIRCVKCRDKQEVSEFKHRQYDSEWVCKLCGYLNHFITGIPGLAL